MGKHIGWLTVALMIALVWPGFLRAGDSLPMAAATRGEEQTGLYQHVSTSAERVTSIAYSMVPGGRAWMFDREREQEHLRRLQAAAEELQSNQAAWEDSLTPEQIAKCDTQLHTLRQLCAELDFHVRSLEHELQKQQPARWRLSKDATAIPKVIKEWKKQNNKMAKSN